MGEISKVSGAYRNLVRSGVSTGALENISYSLGEWRLQFRKNPSLSREAAKQTARDYLRDEFEAQDINFFASRTQPDALFFATFRSNAL